ncbi:MAG TPA: His/Gly/Thr/Pro-type tRNA ligase C-terminal domain-containing protein, partial [Coriobacteriia bacterium]|nr:His/Gly/Thr/Pro-type tRNA ligase C-terminal domain-containing protein [Coriobacteriia bacterium]
PTPGLGWALGFERTLLAMRAAHAETPPAASADVYVAHVDDSVAEIAFAIASELRDAGVSAALDHSGRSLKAQFKQADRCGARVVVIAGPDELAAGEVTLRDMRTKEETRAPRAQVIAATRRTLG